MKETLKEFGIGLLVWLGQTLLFGLAVIGFWAAWSCHGLQAAGCVIGALLFLAAWAQIVWVGGSVRVHLP